VSDTIGIMSDMNSQRITVRVPTELGARLRGHSRRKGQSPSDLVRVALENYLEKADNTGSALDLAEAAGLIGCVQRAPRDLSTNRRHLDGFGKNK
jgi:predicted DNA-binding protein